MFCIVKAHFVWLFITVIRPPQRNTQMTKPTKHKLAAAWVTEVLDLSPPLTTRSGLGPLNSLMTMVMSEIMSRVGTKIQNVRIRMKILLSNSAMSDAPEWMRSIFIGFNIYSFQDFGNMHLFKTRDSKYPWLLLFSVVYLKFWRSDCMVTTG